MSQAIALAYDTQDDELENDPVEVHPGNGTDSWIADLKEVRGYDARTRTPNYGSVTMVDLASLSRYRFETLVGEELSAETVAQKARDAAQ